MNKNLPKPPETWFNGRKIKSLPECAYCGLVAEEKQPDGWDYVEELNPINGNGGYICPKCQDK